MSRAAKSPVLALLRPAPGLADAVRTALTEVWTGEVREVASRPGSAALVVLAAETVPELFAALEPDPGRVPVLGVVALGARAARAQPLAAPLAWIVGTDELSPAFLGLSLRYALEVGTRWRLSDQVGALQPLANLGSSAAVASHELANVLTGLLLDVETARQRSMLAARENPRLAELDHALGDVLEGSRLLARIASDLSRVARPAGRITPLDPAELVDTARRLCGDVLRGVAFTAVVVRPCEVRADERRLTQVLVNLVRNAAQALAGRPSPQIRVELDRVGAHGVLRVADNGPGLPRVVRERLFQPWTTTRPSGTGLGLSVSRRYTTEMGGTLEWVPTDVGAVFEIRLPLGDVVRPTLVPDLLVHGARVLVVDDAEVVRRSLARTLRTVGTVDTAHDLAGALALVSRNRYDVLIVDMNLPDGNGRAMWELADPWTREHMVFLSGDYTAEEETWLEERRIPFAVKPIGGEEVRQLVSRLAGRS